MSLIFLCALPARSFHVVNAPMLFSVGYNILKPFVAEEYKVKDCKNIQGGPSGL